MLLNTGIYVVQWFFLALKLLLLMLLLLQAPLLLMSILPHLEVEP